MNRQKCTAKVIFPDWDEKVSFDLPVMQKNTLNTKHYWMPEPNEQVVCGFFANGTQEGVILGAIYSEADKVPEDFLVSDDCDGVLYPDGTLIRYDSKNHLLTIDVKGRINVKADFVHVDSEVQITRDVVMNQNLTVDQTTTTNHLDADSIEVGTLTAGSITAGTITQGGGTP